MPEESQNVPSSGLLETCYHCYHRRGGSRTLYDRTEVKLNKIYFKAGGSSAGSLQHGDVNRQKLAGHARNRSHKCGLRLSSLILPAWDLVSRCCFKAFCKGTSNKHSLEWNLEVISAISKHYKFQTFQFYCTMFYAISLSFCLLSSILINPVPGSQRRSRRSRSPGKKCVPTFVTATC